ncbi:MAG TPA: hypothetical protein PKL39_08315 [Bacillota bacterium]|nr:hypothetical protein [Bacillota bacterium]
MHLNLSHLLTAMAIVAVLTVAVNAWSVAADSRLKLQQAAYTLAQDLQAARQLAEAQNVTVQVYFEWSRRSYVICRPGMPAQRVELPRGVQWTCPFDYIYFYGNGRCSHNGTFTLYLEEGARMQVIVAPRTGRVRVREGS